MAILNVSSYITSAGLQAVTSAGQIGPYFAIKYFVPFYDPRIDASISKGNGTNTSALNISAMNLTSATAATLFGEKIYASSAANYSLSNSNFFYQQSGMNTLVDGATGVLNAKQEVASNVNMLNGVPLSQCVSATSFSPSGTTGNFNLVNVKNITAATYNPLSAQPYPTSAFYRVQSYSPKGLGTTSASGSFKCRIPFGDGSFKFNGLALFVGKVDQYGYDTVNTNPVLFAVVLMDKPQEKSKLVGGMNSYEIDVDLGFDWSSIGKGGNTPVYVETGYWTKVPTSSNTSAYALNYDGDVVISSSASPGSWMPQAKLTITDPSKAQVRLAYNNNDSYGDRYTDFRTRRFRQQDAVEFGYGSTDRAVLKIDTSCDKDSLLELGKNNLAQSIKSIAMGISSSATYAFSGSTFVNSDDEIGLNIAFGTQALAAGDYNKSFGAQTSAIGMNNMSIGERTYAGGPETYWYPTKKYGFNIALGDGTSAVAQTSNYYYNGYFSGEFSDDDKSTGYNISIGKDSYATNGFSLAIGREVSATGFQSTSIGANINNTSNFGLAIGYSLSATNDFNYVFGFKNNVTTRYSLVGGGKNTIGGSNGYSLAYGQSLSASSDYALTFGYANKNDGNYSLNFGTSNKNSGTYSLAFGNNVSATNYYSLAFGNNLLVNGMFSTSFGNGNKVYQGGSFVAGYSNNVEGNSSGSTVFGRENIVEYTSSHIIGISNLSRSANGNIFMVGNGNESHSSTGNTYLFGQQNIATTNSTWSLAFGQFCEVRNNNSMAIGFKAITDKDNQVVIGGQGTSNITLKADTITLDGDLNKNPMWRVWIEKTFTGSTNNETLFKMTHKIKLTKITESTQITKEIQFSTYRNNITLGDTTNIKDEFNTSNVKRNILILLDKENFNIYIEYSEATSTNYNQYDLIYVIETQNGICSYYNFDKNVVSYYTRAENHGGNYAGTSLLSNSYFNGYKNSKDVNNCLFKSLTWQDNYYASNGNRTAEIINDIYVPTSYNFEKIENRFAFYNLHSAGATRQHTIIYTNDVSVVDGFSYNT